MRVEILDIDGKKVQLKLIDELDFDELLKSKHKERYFAYLELWQPGTTTDEQRKHYWALIGDISDYTGEPSWKIVLNMKYLYMVQHDKTKEPSMARNKLKKEDASKLIQTIIDYCLDNGIPLQNNYLDEMNSKHLFKMTMNRICWTCGKSAQIHHVNAVGMGRNRSTYENHDEHLYMALCPNCHSEAHRIGQKTFENKYHVQGIKLSKENLKRLGVSK